MMNYIYFILLFLVIAWIMQAWDIYRIKIFNPLGTYFDTHGQLIWIALVFWGCIFYVWKYSKESFTTECDCPVAFPKEQRFSDGKITVGIKGSYFYPLPLKCGIPVGVCSKPLPSVFPKSIKQWNWLKTNSLTSTPKKQETELPTYRDKYGIGPRSYWCIETDRCKRFIEDPLRPWKTKCGEPMVQQVPKKVFTSHEECEQNRTPCKNLDSEQCVHNSMCGWCQDRNGNGICIDGTPEGPFDYSYNCTPNLLQQQTSGSWTPGHNNTYILQEQTNANPEWLWNPEVQ